MKSQNVRLLDVFAFGPFMLYIAAKGNMTREERFFMALLGIGTIAYNANNYLQVQRENNAAA